MFVKFRIFPRTSEPLRRPSVSVNFLTGPMFSVLLLLAVKAINGAMLKHGIIGADGVKPISIMALFISLVRGRGFTASMCSSFVTSDGNGRHISPSPWMRPACSAFWPFGLPGKVEPRVRGYTFTSTCSFWHVLQLSET